MLRRLASRRLTTSAASVRGPTWPQLLRLTLPGSLDSWEKAGFSRNNDADDFALSVGGVDIGIGGNTQSAWGWRDGPRTRGRTAESGGNKLKYVERRPVVWEGIETGEHFTEYAIDGVPTSIDDMDDDEHTQYLELFSEAAAPHPNGAVGIYSVCVTTPHFESTIEAFEDAGLELRRVRKAEDPASPLSRGLSMAFFKFVRQ